MAGCACEEAAHGFPGSSGEVPCPLPLTDRAAPSSVSAPGLLRGSVQGAHWRHHVHPTVLQRNSFVSGQPVLCFMVMLLSAFWGWGGRKGERQRGRETEGERGRDWHW